MTEDQLILKYLMKQKYTGVHHFWKASLTVHVQTVKKYLVQKLLLVPYLKDPKIVYSYTLTPTFTNHS